MTSNRRIYIIATMTAAVLVASVSFGIMTKEAPDKPIVLPKTITTTTTTTTTMIPQPPTPIDVPPDNYAPEPVVEYGTIEIPKIGVSHKTYHGITLHNVDHGPSHWPGSAHPGDVGNSVFFGHRVTRTKPFRNIDQLVPGDEVIFKVGERVSTYVMTGSSVVTPSATHIAIQTVTPTATLFACHPPGSAKFRYVVNLALKT